MDSDFSKRLLANEKSRGRGLGATTLHRSTNDITEADIWFKPSQTFVFFTAFSIWFNTI